MDALSMHLAASRGRASVGSEIELQVELRNVSDANLVIGGYQNGGLSLARLLQVSVFDDANRPLRSSGPILKSGVEPRLRPIELAPGESIRAAPIPASSIQTEVHGEWAALNSRRGTFSIQLVYELRQEQLEGDHWSGSAISNSIQLQFE